MIQSEVPYNQAKFVGEAMPNANDERQRPKPFLAMLFMLVGVCAAGSAAAEGDPLSADQLAECAEKVQTLRGESTRLNDQAARLDDRQAEISRSYQAMGEDRTHDELLRYNARASALNDDVAAFKQAVAEINQVKQAYDRRCADRPYSRSDLQALPADLQQAMQSGMRGVRVPYTQDSAPGN